MSKQYQGSKKKARRNRFIERDKKRANKRAEIISIEKATTIEELAMAMGVKLT